MRSILRFIFWFERGEGRSIWKKLNSPKPKYEANWESEVLMVLAGGVFLAFYFVGMWLGLFWLVVTKMAVQGLNKKGFFDPQHPEE